MKNIESGTFVAKVKPLWNFLPKLRNALYRVLMQIVQELCKRPGLNRSGFDMPTIYLPDICTKVSLKFFKTYFRQKHVELILCIVPIFQPTRCANQIMEVCSEVEKVIEQTVQNSLNNLEGDCKLFREQIHSRLESDTAARNRNWKSGIRSKLKLYLEAMSLARNSILEIRHQLLGLQYVGA